MSEERIMILRMLEEGKIGADEAAKLLGSIKEESEEASIEKPKIVNIEKPTIPVQPVQQTQTVNNQNNAYNNNTNNKNNSAGGGGSSINFDDLGRTIGSLSREMAKKAGVFAKEMTPKLQSITETLVEKTVSVTDKISKSVSTPSRPVSPPPAPASRPAPPPPRPMPPKPSVTRPTTIPKNGRPKEKSCEIAVNYSTSNELYITSKHGVVSITGYNGDKITAKINYVSNSDNIELSQSGDRYYLDYDDSEFSSVSIEAFIPSKLFKRIQISADTSKVTLDGLASEELIVETISASISLKNLDSSYIKAVTDRGDVMIENIVSGSLEVITANGKIDSISLDVQKLKIETDNCPINYKLFMLKKYTNYSWKIGTSNASMRINLPIGEDIGYDIKANTSLNNVSIGIAGLQYIYNESSYIEAKTANFSKATKKVKVEMDTSNAPITIN